MRTLAPTAPAAAGHRVPGLGDVVRSEWTKLRSVRSTVWTLVALVVVTIGFSALICAVTTASDVASPDFDPTSQSIVGGFFGQVAAVVLGVLAITSEYTKGGIRISLTAVPHRLRLIAAKAIVVCGVLTVVSLVTVFVSFTLGQSILAGQDADVALGDPGVLRAVVGGALYLVASGMFGLALGVLLRQSAGAITGALVMLFVAPPLVTLVPGSAGETISRYFTSNAGQAVLTVVPQDNSLGPWAGYAVYSLWWIVPLALGSLLLVRRDAA